MNKIAVIGGGPAGMMAAYSAAASGADVTLLEQNEKLGKKLYITGKGRCNLTNRCDISDFFDNVVTNSKFLYSALYSFTNEDAWNFFEEHGLRLKEERGKRVFPASDHSSDVIRTLEKALKEEKVKIRLNSRVERIERGQHLENRECPENAVRLENGGHLENAEHLKNGTDIAGNCSTPTASDAIRVILKGGDAIPCDAVIIATGGLSYASTGATGDGYRFALESGHRVTECYPALCPIRLKEAYVKELEGLSLKNISISIRTDSGKEIYHDFGEMLFTAHGVSGPVILSASSRITKRISDGEPIRLVLDLKPALDEKQLDARLLKDFSEAINKDFRNSLGKLLPSKMIPQIVALSGIDPYKKVNEITREERRRLVNLLKGMEFGIEGTEGYSQAVITQGGVSVRDIDPKAMRSKVFPGMYYAGEVLDVDAFTGGFNIQIAMSTGWLAGRSAAEA